MEPSTGPIHSRLAEDPARAEAIETFVLGLAERVDDLQDTEARGELKALAERAGALGAEAAEAGYPLLRRSADEVCAAAEQGNGELVRKALIQLTNIAQRVRQGHRGSLG